MIKYIDIFMDAQKSEKLLNECIDKLFTDGAIDVTLLELITNIKVYQQDVFKKYENKILLRMGLFYKPLEIESFEDGVFKIYWDYILNTHNENFTPVQADIVDNIENNTMFSFSSPTSTGKSFIFRYLIQFFQKDIVIIVPSRALINEYFKRVSQIVDTRKVNVLTFVDFVNTKKTERNIFIITPERSRDLFVNANKMTVDLFLFDEAQLSEEDNIRGMYYDSVVRRVFRYFPQSRYVFAYPFVDNPEAQFTKNPVDFTDKNAIPYNYRNVGQIFYSFDDDGNFYNFGTDEKTTGKPVLINFDPLEKVLIEGGTALIYCAKSKIYDSSIINKFKKYVKYCTKITDIEALKIIDKVRIYIGASQNNSGDFSSLMIRWMRRGIVFHHGSLPLRVRLLIEEFTQKGFCKVCFATATLEQGINMPFDLVWIERLHNSRELSVKNLIGRAGRSTDQPVFDYGQVVIKDTKRKNLSKIVRKDISLETESQLDNLVDQNDDYREYKEAIKNGTFSEEFNLTNSELNRIEMTTSDLISFILNNLYEHNEVDFSKIDSDEQTKTQVTDAFINIYQRYLDRPLTRGEDAVLSTAVKILFWRVKGKKFSQIVSYRYSYASQIKIRKDFEKAISSSENLENNYALKNLLKDLKAQWITQYKPIPDKNFKTPFSLTYNKLAIDVDYDRMVVDTYDYIDKLIGFRLGDVYYAAFSKYADNNENDPYLRERAKTMLDLIKYGTNSKKEIWLLRYGFDFDDIEWLSPIVKSINEEEIIFHDLTDIDNDQKERILKFL